MIRLRLLWPAVLLVFAGFWLVRSPSVQPRTAEPEPAPDFAKAGFAFLQKHCLGCHGEKDAKAELSLHTYRDEAAVLKGRKVWLKVVEMVQTGEMPPKKQPRPDAAEVDAFVKVVNGVFDRADRNAKPDPGRVTVRRLNRAEYNNTIRDLVGVDFNPAEDFPADDVGHGFDNIGDVLSLSPVLMERYLAAAESIVQRAIQVGEPPKPPQRHTAAHVPRLDAQAETVPRGARPQPGRQRQLPHDAQADRARASTSSACGAYGRQVGDEPVKIAFSVDGKELGSRRGQGHQGQARHATSRPREARARRPSRSSFAFLNEFTDPDEADKPEDAKRELFVQNFEFEGPMDMTPPAHSRIMACDASKPKREQAREILTRFASRGLSPAGHARTRSTAWSSWSTPPRPAASAGKRAIQLAHAGGPGVAEVPLPRRTGRSARQCRGRIRSTSINWPRGCRTSSGARMPDDELFDLAAKKQLTANLDAQVRRMLKDPKAKALVENFAMQWLQLRRLEDLRARSQAVPAASTSRCAPPCSRKPNCSSTRSSARTAASST